MATERTLILIKPDGVKRQLTGTILSRIEAKGYVIAELKQVSRDPRTARGALRGARGQAVLRAAGRLHALRPASWRSSPRART